MHSYQRNWTCCQCGTVNSPEYETCQECLADIDGILPEPELVECDCCGKRAELSRGFYHGIETYACEECRA